MPFDLADMGFQMAWLILPLTGLVASLLAGLLGIGGGIVLVPALFFFVTKIGIAPGNEMQFVLGTSLACILPSSLTATYMHQKLGNINWTIYKRLVPGFLVGGLLGGLLANILDSDLLKKLFAILCFFLAARILFGFKPKPTAQQNTKSLLHTISGGVMGTVASLTGIGGGALVNPYLLWAGYPMRFAIGTSAAAVVAIVFFGSITYALATPSVAIDIPHIGYVMWPAVIAVSVISMIMAPIGAKWAQKVPTDYLRKLLAVLLFIVAIKFLIG